MLSYTTGPQLAVATRHLQFAQAHGLLVMVFFNALKHICEES